MIGLVYTCVFGGYDRLFPPVEAEDGITYIAVTDDDTLKVDGWQTLVVDRRCFADSRLANRYFKMLGLRDFRDYDASVYVDGNVRILGGMAPLMRELLASGAALGAHRHTRRSTVAEEVAACARLGKAASPERLQSELDDYVRDGFPDNVHLVEATILVRNHRHPDLDAAMRLWWDLFQRYRNRDQISLPYVLWKTNLPVLSLQGGIREPNRHFGIYPHAGIPGTPALYVTAAARSFDNLACRLLLKCWHAKWAIQRLFRFSR